MKAKGGRRKDEKDLFYSAFILHPSSLFLGPNAVGTTSLEMAGQSLAGVSTNLVGLFILPPSSLVFVMANAGAEYMVSVSDRVRIPAPLIDIR